MDTSASERPGELVKKSGKTPSALWVARLLDAVANEGSDET
jgi:hypothetical protein